MDTSAAASNDTKLALVQGLQEGAGSGVYIVERESEQELPNDAEVESETGKTRKAMNPLLEQVTLVVYGWKNVEPGTLSWVFPSVTAAVGAARAMTNAVRWAIVAGKPSKRETVAREASDEASLADANRSLDEARARGAVLIEQAG